MLRLAASRLIASTLTSRNCRRSGLRQRSECRAQCAQWQRGLHRVRRNRAAPLVLQRPKESPSVGTKARKAASTLARLQVSARQRSRRTAYRAPVGVEDATQRASRCNLIDMFKA